MRSLIASRKSNQVWILIVLLVPLVYLSVWMLLNNQLPIGDGSNYLSTAVAMKNRFFDHGFFSGMKSVFTIRGWRPIFYPVIILPFILLTSGNVLLAYSLLSVSVLAASVVYTYMYLRLVLNAFAAALASCFIGLLPSLLAGIINASSESALFPCVMGSLYHLIESDYFRDKKHSLGFVVLATVGFLIRPVEMLMSLLFILGYFFFSGVKQRIFSNKNLAKLFYVVFSLMLLTVCAILWRYVKLNADAVMGGGGQYNKEMALFIYRFFVWAVVLGCLLLLVGLRHQLLNVYHQTRSLLRSSENRTLLLPVMVSIMTGVFLWYLPFASRMFEWVYRTSIGDLAVNTGDLTQGDSILQQIRMQTLAEGGLAVLGSLLMAVIATLVVSKARLKKTLFSQPVLFLLLLIPLPVLEVFATVQSSPRKLSVAFPALLMTLMIVILQSGRGYVFRLLMVASLIVSQMCLYYSMGLLGAEPNMSTEWLNKLVGYQQRLPDLVKPNAHDVLVSILDKEAKAHNLKEISIQVNPNKPTPVDPFIMNLIAGAKHSYFFASYPYYSSYISENILKESKRVDAIFIADLASRMQVSSQAARNYKVMIDQEHDASLKTLYRFLYEYANKSIQLHGWVQGPCTILTSSGNRKYKGCLFYSSNHHAVI